MRAHCPDNHHSSQISARPAPGEADELFQWPPHPRAEGRGGRRRPRARPRSFARDGRRRPRPRALDGADRAHTARDDVLGVADVVSIVAVGAALHVAQLARAAAEVLVEMAVLERARHREARLPPLEELEVWEENRPGS